jgi:hypothetical protein
MYRPGLAARFKGVVNSELLSRFQLVRRVFMLLYAESRVPELLFLQVKEAQASVLEPFLGKSQHVHHGERYYVRQLHDWKGGIDVERLQVPGATLYARICGATLARAHARWGGRIAIAAYLGKGDVFDRAMAAFSVAYADQNERDYNAFVEAVSSGRITAQPGL